MNGTNAQTDTENGRWCDICAQNGHKVKLQYFQINYEDAILICPAKECTYPLDSKPLDNIIVKRKPEDIVSSIKRKRRKLDLNPHDKESNPFISKKSMPNSGLVYDNASLRSSALDSLTARIMENISQSGATSFLSFPVHKDFVSSIFDDEVSSVLNSRDCLPASADTDSNITPYITNLSPANVDCQGLVPGDNLADISSLINVHCFSNQGFIENTTVDNVNSDSLIENTKINVLNSDSLIEVELSECELKTKALAAVEFVDTCNAGCDGQITEPSYGELNLGPNPGNPIALYPKNIAKASMNCVDPNSVISDKEVFLGAENSDSLNANNIDAVILSSQNCQISVKWESMNSDKLDSLHLMEPDATCAVKQNSVSEVYNSVHDDKRCSTEKDVIHNQSKSEPSKEVYLKFLQWKNRDSLCWLDVVMSLLMHCKTLRLWLSKAQIETCLIRLVGSFDRSQRLFRQGLELRRCVGLCRMGRTVKLETSVGDVMVKTGGGNSSDILFGARAIATIAMDEVEGCSVEKPFDVRNIFSREDPNTVSIEKMLQEADRLDSLSKKTLSDARDSIFASLEPNLHCEKGLNDSPLMALIDLLARDPVGKNLKMHYRWTLNCSACKETHQDSVSKEVMTFLKLPENFRISEPCFMRNCFSCKAPDQLLCIEFDRLPDMFFHHFLEGIHHCDLADLDFEFEGDKYAVTGMVQYKTNPDHFVCWLREPVADFWMECDDLKNCVCKYSDSSPTLPASQVHIVMWEKQSQNSGYRLPCEREPFKKVERARKSVVDCVLSNKFPPPAMASSSINSASAAQMHTPGVSLPAAAVLRPSSISQNGASVIASVQIATLKDQDENCSKLCRKMADNTRLQRMKQKYELDRRRSSSLNSSKPVIPRIPIGISTVHEQPNRANFHSTPGMMDSSGRRYSPSMMAGCIFSKKLSKSSVQSMMHENNSAKPDVRAGRHSIAAVQARSLLKVGRQSYLETILPLITESKQSTAAVQKFEAYVPKSQKVTSTVADVKPSVTDQGNTALDIKTRKAKVCFSECNLLNDGQHQLSESNTTCVSTNQTSTKSGILAKPCVLTKLSSQFDHKFSFDDVDFDFSNLMDLDKILLEGNNSLAAQNILNNSVACPLLQCNGGDVSNLVSATVESCGSDFTSTNAIEFDVLSMVQENSSGFASTVFGDNLNVAVHSSLPDLGDFITWTSSLSGSSYTNIVSDCKNSSVVNTSLSNSASCNYLNDNTSDVFGYAGVNDIAVTNNLPVLPSTSDIAEAFTNLPLPVQSFNFGEEDWSWFS